MKLLLVTMYYPPTGGGSVQRPLAYATHLPELGFETFVMTPDDSKWTERDESLAQPPSARVVRVRNLGPGTRHLGYELHGHRGVRRLGVHARSAGRRMLVPDGSVVWSAAAAASAVRLVRRERIDVVLTTSPPLSVNLVGAITKRLTGARWVADLRDSIVFHQHRRRDVRGESLVARLVARRADAVVTASPGIADELRRLGRVRQLDVIESGCDFETVAMVPYERSDRLRITHTGNFLGSRDPRPFLDALAASSPEIVARFVGTSRPRDREHALSLGLQQRVEWIPFVPRHVALAMQRDSDVLLLLVPDAGGRGRSVVTGKVFEYLAARRPILAAVPPAGDAAALVRRSGAGTVVHPQDVNGIADGLREMHDAWRKRELDDVLLAPNVRVALSWRASVERLACVLRSVS